MDFFKLKEADVSLVVACEHCGERKQKTTDRCKSCKMSPAIKLDEMGKAPAADCFAGQLSTSVSDQPETAGLRAAPLKARVIAALLDHVGIFALSFILFLVSMVPPAHYLMTARPLFAPFGAIPSLVLIGLLVPIAMLLPIIYFAWFESSSRQATPGKQLMGLRVIGLKSREIGIGRALSKSILQYIILYALSLVAALPIALLCWLLNRDEFNYLYYVIDGALALLVMCVPFFNSGKQSALDWIVGRMVVKAADVREQSSAKKTGSEWKYVRLGLAAATMIVMISGLIVALPYNLIFLSRSWESMPIAERGFSLDPFGETREARQFIRQAKAKNPDLFVTYSFSAGLAKVFAQPELAEDLNYRSSAVMRPDDTRLDRAQYMKKKNQLERAVALYKEEMAAPIIEPNQDYRWLRSLDAARGLLALDRFAEANAGLTVLIDRYRANYRAKDSQFRAAGQLHLVIYDLYLLRAQSWKGLNKPALAAADEQRAREWTSNQ